MSSMQNLLNYTLKKHEVKQHLWIDIHVLYGCSSTDLPQLTFEIGITKYFKNEYKNVLSLILY